MKNALELTPILVAAATGAAIMWFLGRNTTTLTGDQDPFYATSPIATGAAIGAAAQIVVRLVGVS